MNKLNKKGFTLIEVVLVLAIGGLIFLLAFIAFQQVSVNRRDTQRRSDAGRIISSLQNYSADTGGSGALTTDLTGGSSSANSGICADTQVFMTKYLCTNGLFLNPNGNNYNSLSAANSADPTKDTIKIQMKLFVPSLTACDGSTLPPTGYKVLVGLEKGVTCRDSK